MVANYKPGKYPIIPGGDPQYLRSEFDSIAAALKSTQDSLGAVDLTALETDVAAAQSDITTLQATSPPGLVFLQRQTVTSPVAAIDFTGLDTTYDVYVFEGTNLRPSVTTGGAIAARCSNDNGASFYAGANYSSTSIYSYQTFGSFVFANNYADATQSMFGVTHAIDVPNTTGYLNFTMHCYGMSVGPVFGLFDISSVSWHSSLGNMWIKTAALCNAGGTNAIRFLAHSGSNIATGTITLYGMRKT